MNYTQTSSGEFGVVLVPFQDYQGETRGYIKAVLSRADVLTQQKEARTQVILTVLISLVVAMLVLYWLTESIVRPIRKVQGLADALAIGDFTQSAEVNTKDELGVMAEAMNKAMASLRGLILRVAQTVEQLAASAQELSSSAEEVSQASGQVTETINQLASGADQQAKAASEAGSAVESMSHSIVE